MSQLGADGRKMALIGRPPLKFFFLFTIDKGSDR